MYTHSCRAASLCCLLHFNIVNRACWSTHSALLTSIIYDGMWNWLWLKDPYWNKMSFSIIATQINLCFPVIPLREHLHNPEFMTTDISSWQNTGDCIVIIVKLQDGRGQAILHMTTGKGDCGDNAGLTGVSRWINDKLSSKASCDHFWYFLSNAVQEICTKY